MTTQHNPEGIPCQALLVSPAEVDPYIRLLGGILHLPLFNTDSL